MNRAAWLVPMTCLVCLSTGCVTRRVLITSDPPGAIVYRNGVYLGPTPVEEPFVYYGKYHYRLVHDGYETLDVTQDVPSPWFELPGIDFISENVIPYTFRDVRPFHYKLEPAIPVRPDDIRTRAEGLRLEGKAIQPPPDAPPPPQRRPKPAPAPAPTLPAPTPAPAGTP
jgi:PEGA domain